MRDSSFDELARGLDSGSISRGKAIRLMGAVLLGGTLASMPGMALADDECKRDGKKCRKNKQCCSGNCSGGTCQAQTTTTTTSTTSTSTTSTPGCIPNNGSCISSDKCCSGRCAGGVCAASCATGAVTLSNGTCARDCSSDAAVCVAAGCLRCTPTEEQKSLGEAYCSSSITRGLCPNGTTAECPTGTFCATGRTCVAAC